ncbi:MAG: response regulator [Phycisphaerae bacterium]|nr:response regulator [Phycisphaerae bacterium]
MADEGTTPAVGAGRQPERILLVDDNPTNLQVLFKMLDGRGYELRIAKTGEDALAIACDARPALILLDIMMPGIDGYEVCRRLKEDPTTRDATVIFLSALDETKDKVRGLELGAVDYVAKPFDVEEVIARVETHMALYRERMSLSQENRDLQDKIAAIGRPGGRLEGLDDEGIEALIRSGEGEGLEFKSTLRWNLKADKAGKEIELAWLKTVVAFLNTDGGMLLIGVEDDGHVLGLERDRFPSEDRFLLHVNNLLREHIGLEFSRFIHFGLKSVAGCRVLVVACDRCPDPAFLKKGDDEEFYIRVGPGSRKLSTSEVLSYLKTRSQGGIR